MSNRTFMHYGWIIIALVVLTAILFTATPFTQLVFNTAQKPVEDIGNQLDTCSHLHTKQESSYTRQDNDRHEVITRTVCEDCGKTLSEYSLGVYENHVYDENYVCTLCGYIHQHAHTTLITSKYKDFDETRHIYVSSYACNCGHVIDYVNFIGEHEYPADGNICSLCGHVKAKPSQSINIDNVSFIMRYGTGTRSSFISSSDGGTLHVTSSNPSCVQATITDGVITFEVLKPSDTPVTVTITADATENYGPGTLDVTVFAQKGTQKIVPSSGGMSIRITNTKPFSAVAEGTGVASPSVITLNTLVGGTESNSVARYTGTNGQLSISGDLYGASEGLAYVHLSLSENDYYEAAEMYIPITVSSLLEQEISVSSKSNFSDSVTSVTKTYNDPNFTLYAKTNGNGALSVSSSNTNVIAASISGGTITLDVKNAGSSTITVSAAQTLTYASSTYTVTITVQKQTPAVTFNDINMTYGEAAKTATYTVTTGTSSELSVVYKTTSNTNVAVSSNFTVTALKAGTSVITYTISGNAENVGNYNTIESTCTVTIAKAVQTINATDKSLIVDASVNIGATVTGPGDAVKGTLTYDSADKTKLIVAENGLLTALKGVSNSDSTTVKVTIYAAENDWYNPASKEITVTITKKTPTIILSKDKLELLYNGTTGVVNYSTNGPALPVANVTTSDKTVAYLVASAHSTTAFTVSPNHIQVSDSVNTYQTTEGGGTAYEGRIGTATITITFPTDEYWLAATRTIPVTVTKGTPVLTINSTDASALSDVPFGTDKNLRYSWIGDNNLSVTSSNSSVFTVSPAANWNRNQTVTIHPVAPGTATVDFTAAEGTHFTALSKQSVTVTVTKGTQTLVPSVTSWSTSYNNTKTFNLSSSTKSGDAAFGAVTYKMGTQSYVTSGESKDAVASISYNSSTGVFTLTTIKPGTTKAYLYYAATSHYNASDVVEIEITVAKGTQTTNTSINSWNTAYSGSTTFNLESSTKSGGQSFGTVTYKIGSQSYVTSGTSADTVASVSYNSSTGVFTLTSLKPGTTTFYVYHEATDYYQKSTAKTFTITVTKGTQTMASDTTSWNVPYGSTKSVSIAGSTKSGSHAYGTITYKMGSNSYISNGVSKDAVAGISYNTSTGKFELTTVKPGTTKAYIKYASSDWYNESNVVEISITVTKGSQSISSVSNLGNVKYGTNPATAITLTKSGSADFGTISVTSSLPSAATVALSGSGNSRTATVTTVKPNDNTVTITISIAGNEYYDAATDVKYTLKVIKGDQTLSMSDAAIAFTSTGSAWSSDVNRNITLTKSGATAYGALTATSTNESVATAEITGSGDSRTLTVHAVGAGSCSVTVSLAATDWYNAPSPASITITNVSVTKKSQTLSVDKTSVSLTYENSATVTVGGNTTALKYIVSDSSSAPADNTYSSSGTSYTTTASASNSSGVFTITSLKPGTTYLYIYAPEDTYCYRSTNTIRVVITVSQGSQGLTLSDANNVIFTSTGTTWSPATSITKTLTMSKSGSANYGTLSVTSSDSNIASVSVTGSGDSRSITVTPGTKEGTATITISLAETDWYDDATIEFTATLTKKAQTITTDKTSSGVSLIHKNSNIITVSGANSTVVATSSNTNVATVSVSGNVVTVNAASYPSTLSSCTISIYAQENTYYKKSNTVNVTATVGKGTQEITLSSGGQMTFIVSGGVWSPETVDYRNFEIYKSGDAPFGSLTATSSDTSVATVALSGSGNNRTVTVTPKASGSSVITISLGGTDYYSAATSQKFTVVVNKANQTWTLSSTSVTQTYNPTTAPTTNVTISGTTYGTVQYKVAGQSYITSGESKDSDASKAIASVTKSGSNYVITGLKAGTTTVYIKATGNDYYNDRELTITVTVNKAKSSISTTSASATYGNGATETLISKVGDGVLSLDTSTLATNIATVTLSDGKLVVTPVKPGETSVKLSISAGANYAAEGPITVTITINKNTQTISSLTLGSSAISVGGTTTVTASYSHGGSGTAPCGTLSFTSSNTGVATLSGSGDSRTVTGVAKGSSTITATLAATEYYTAASKTVTISVKAVTNFSLSKTAISVNYGASNQTVTVSDLTSGYDGTLAVSTSNSNVATASISGNTITIDPGYVGTATITVSAPATSGYTAQSYTISVTVNPLQRTLTADKTNVSLTNVNETATVTINTNNFGTLTATSASTSIATCSLSGSNGDATRTLTIKLVSVGTTSITVTAQAYNAGGSSENEYTAKTIVILVKKGSALSVTPSSKSIKVGDTSSATVSALNGYPLSSVTISGYNSSIIDNVSYNTSTGVISFRGKSVGTTTITISGPAVGDFTAPISTTLTIEVTNSQSSQTVSLSPTSLSLTRGYVYTGQTNNTWSHTGYGSYNSASTTLGGTYVGTIYWRVGTSNAWITGNNSQTDGNITVTRSGNTFTATTSGDGSTTLYVYAAATTSGMVDYLVSNTATCTITASHATSKDVYNKGGVSQSPTLTPGHINLSRTVTNVGTIAGGRTPIYGPYNSGTTVLGGTYGGKVSWRVGTSNEWKTEDGSQGENNISVSKSGTTFTATASGDGTTTLYVKVAAYSTDYVNYAEKVITCTITAISNNEDQNGTQSISWSTGGTSPKNATLTTSAPSVNYTIVTGGTTYRTSLLRATSENTGIATVSVDGNVVTITKVANGSTTVTIKAIAGDYLDASEEELVVNVSCSNAGLSQNPIVTPSPNPLTLTRGYIYTGQSNNTWKHTGYTAYSSGTVTLGGTYGGTVYWKLGSNSYTTGDGSQTDGYITVTRSGNTFTATATSPNSTASDGTSTTLYVKVGSYSSGGYDYAEAIVSCTISLSHVTSKDVYNAGTGSQSPTLSPASLELTRGYIYTGQSNNTWSHTGYTAYNSASTTLGGTYYGAITWNLTSKDAIEGNGTQSNNNISVSRSGTTFTASASGDGSTTLTVNVASYSTSAAKLDGSGNATCYTWTAATATCSISAGHDTNKDVYNAGSGGQSITLSPTALTVAIGGTGNITIGGTYGGTLSVESSDTSKVTFTRSGTKITVTGVAKTGATITVSVTAYSTSAAKLDGSGNATCYNWSASSATCEVTVSNNASGQTVTLSPTSVGPTRGINYVYVGNPDHTWTLTSSSYGSYNSTSTTLSGTYYGTIYWRLGTSNSWTTGNGSQSSGNITVTRSSNTFTFSASGDSSVTLYVYAAATTIGTTDYSASPTATCTITSSHDTGKDTSTYNRGSQSISLSTTSLDLTRGINHIYTGNPNHTWTETSTTYGSFNTAYTDVITTYMCEDAILYWILSSSSTAPANGYASNSNSQTVGNITVSRSGNRFTASATGDGTVYLYVYAGQTTYCNASSVVKCTITASHDSEKDTHTYNRGTQSISFSSTTLSLSRTITHNGQLNNTWSESGSFNSLYTDVNTTNMCLDGTLYWILSSSSTAPASGYVSDSNPQTVGNITVSRSDYRFTATATGNGTVYLYAYVGQTTYCNKSTTIKCTITASTSDVYNKRDQSIYFNNGNSDTSSKNATLTTAAPTVSYTIYTGGSTYRTANLTATSANTGIATVSVNTSTGVVTITKVANGSTTISVWSSGNTYLNASNTLIVNITCVNSGASQSPTLSPTSLNSVKTIHRTYTGQPDHTWLLTSTDAGTVTYTFASTTLGGTYGGTVSWRLGTSNSWTTGNGPQSANNITVTRSGATFTVSATGDGSTTLYVRVAAYSSGGLDYSEATVSCTITASTSYSDSYVRGPQNPPDLSPTTLNPVKTITRYYTGNPDHSWTLTSSNAATATYSSVSTTMSLSGVCEDATIYWRLGTSNAWTTGNGSQSSGNITVTRSGNTFTATATADNSTGVTLYVYAGQTTYCNTSTTTTCKITSSTTYDDHYNRGSQNSPTLSPTTLNPVRTITRTYTGQSNNTWSLTSTVNGSYSSLSTTLGLSGVCEDATIYWRVGTSNSWTSGNGSQSASNITVTRSGNTFTASASGDGSTTLYVYAGQTTYCNASATTTCTITSSSVYNDVYNPGYGDQSITLSPAPLEFKVGSSGYTDLSGTYGGAITWHLTSNSATTGNGPQSNNNITVSRSGTRWTATASSTGSTTLTVNVAGYSTSAPKLNGASGNATCYIWSDAEATCAISASYNSSSQSPVLSPNPLNLTRGYIYTGQSNNTWSHTGYTSYNSGTITLSGTYYGAITWKLGSNSYTDSANGSQTSGKVTVTRTSTTTWSVSATSDGSSDNTSVTFSVSIGATVYNNVSYSATTATCTINLNHATSKDVYNPGSGNQSISLSPSILDITQTGSGYTDLSGTYGGTISWYLTSNSSTTGNGPQSNNNISVSRSGTRWTATSSNNGSTTLTVNVAAYSTSAAKVDGSGNATCYNWSAASATCSIEYSEGTQTLSWLNDSYNLSIYRTGTISHTWNVEGSEGAVASAVGPGPTYGTTYWILSSSSTAPASGYVSTNTSMTVNNITVTKSGDMNYSFTAGTTPGTAYLYIYADEYVHMPLPGNYIHYDATSVKKITITSSYSDTKSSQSIYFNSGRTDQAAKSNSFNVGNGTTYTIYTAGTSYRAALLTATSSNSSVASVSVNTSTGKVTINGVAAGSATITIKANSSTYLNASNTLTVNITVNAALIERPYSWTSNSFTGTIYEATKGVKATYTFHTLGTGAVTWSGTFTSSPTGTRVKDTSLVDGEATYTFTGSASNNNGSTFTLTCTVAADSTYKSVSGSITITYRTTPKPSVEIPDVILYQGCGVPLQFGGAKAPGSGVNITLSGVGSGNIPNVIVRYITWTSTPEYNGWYLIGMKEGEFTFSMSIPAYTSGGTSYSAATRTVSAKVEKTVVVLEGSSMGDNVYYVPGDMAGDYEPTDYNSPTTLKGILPVNETKGTKDLYWCDYEEYAIQTPVSSGSYTISDFTCPVCGANHSGSTLSTLVVETFLAGTRIIDTLAPSNEMSIVPSVYDAGNWYYSGMASVYRQLCVPAIGFGCSSHGAYSIFFPPTSITIGVPCEPYWE